MELGRWGLDKISQISDRYRGFSRFLTEVLEGDRPLLASSETDHSTFSVQSGIEQALASESELKSEPGVLDRTVRVLSRLSPFFEAGFMLKVNPEAQNLELTAMFLGGRLFHPPASERPLVELDLPELKTHHVFCVRALKVLPVFRLENVKSLRHADALLFSPRENVAFILLCNRPRPWQITAIEATVIGCEKILHE